MPSEVELLVRLLIAAGLTGALGVEREITDQPAGFRTHILVGLGAALFVEVSAYGFQSVVTGSPPGSHATVDVSRVAAQIVTGIGFLGGGAILKYGASVRGLTTAANLWISAAVGAAVGVGAIGLGATTTGIALLALFGLRPIRTFLRRFSLGGDEFSLETQQGVDLPAILSHLRLQGIVIREVRIAEEGERLSVRILLKLPPGLLPGRVADDLSHRKDVTSVDWTGS